MCLSEYSSFNMGKRVFCHPAVTPLIIKIPESGDVSGVRDLSFYIYYIQKEYSYI